MVPTKALGRTVDVHIRTHNDALRLGQNLAVALPKVGVLRLQGPIGAGKSFLARAIIQRLQAFHGGIAEDVPSPTYTLVQSYNAGDIEVWHCDLYRISDPGELVELGLGKAFSNCLCLVEWAERLGQLAPQDAATLQLDFGKQPDARSLSFTYPSDIWQSAADVFRSHRATEKLTANG